MTTLLELQVKLFKYLGNMISYERELDIDNKLNSYMKIMLILNNLFRSQKTLNTLTTGHANLRFFYRVLHYNYETRMTQICVLTRAWFLRT
jgi:hypothetical protein